MKKYFRVIVSLSALVILSVSFIYSYSYQSSEIANHSLNTTPLEKYMHDKYDSKGYQGYTFVLAVKQPVEGTRIIADEDLNTGHAYIRLAKSGKNAWTSYMSNNLNDTDNFETETLSKVQIHSDVIKDFTMAKVFEITEESANAIVAYLWDYYKSESEYDIANNNCITFALNATKVANIPQSSIGIVPRKWEIPSYIKENPLVMYYIDLKTSNHVGYSSGDAGEDLKSTSDVFYYKDISK